MCEGPHETLLEFKKDCFSSRFPVQTEVRRHKNEKVLQPLRIMRMGIEQLSRVESSALTGFPSAVVGLKDHNTNH